MGRQLRSANSVRHDDVVRPIAGVVTEPDSVCGNRHMGTLLILLCGLALILFANLPDLLGGGHTGIGMTQLSLSIFGLILCVVSFMFKIGPFSWIKVTFQKHDVGKKELWLFGVALILTLFVFDISLSIFN